MEKKLKNTYKVIRSIIVGVLLFFVGLYSILFVVLSIPYVQDSIRKVGETELSKFLGGKIEIGQVSIYPYNEVIINDVQLSDTLGNKIASIEEVGTEISIYDLIFHRRFVFTYAELVGLDAKLSKATPSSPLNIQFILDAVKPKDKNKPPTKFDLAINAIVIRKCKASYDIESLDARADSLFDKNHIAISHLSADIKIPKLDNENYDFEIRRLSFVEKSGFALKELTSNIHVGQTSISAQDLKIKLNNSILIPNDITLTFANLKKIKEELSELPLNIRFANSYVTPSDFAPFNKILNNFTSPVYITCLVDGKIDDINISTLNLESQNKVFSIQTSGSIKNVTNKDSIKVVSPNIKLHINIDNIANKANEVMNLPQNTLQTIKKVGYVNLNGSLEYEDKDMFYVGNIMTALGTIHTDGRLKLNKDNHPQRFRGKVLTKGLNIGSVINNKDLLGSVAFNVKANLNLLNKRPTGKVEGKIDHIDLKGYRYKNILTDLEITKDSYMGAVNLQDPNVNIKIEGLAKIDGKNSIIDVNGKLSDINLHNLNLNKKNPDHKFNADLYASFTGNNLDNAEGDIIISDISYIDNENKGITIDHLDLTARKLDDKQKQLTINSDVINGSVNGEINFAQIGKTFKKAARTILPALIPEEDPQKQKRNKKKKNKEVQKFNNFDYHFVIANNNEIPEFFKLPISVVHPITISGVVDEYNNEISFGLDAPYFMQGNKIIEKTSVSAKIDGASDLMRLNVISQLDHKNGDIMLLLSANASQNHVNTDINWQYDRERQFNGQISLSTALQKSLDNKLLADIDIKPTKFAVNDTTWFINPAKIKVVDKRIELSGINVHRENQFVKANGFVSDSYDDELKLQLSSIDLDYVFETLKINHVVFSGTATGDFFASGLLSKVPRIMTPRLHVKNFAYHHAPLGDADIQSYWDNENKGVVINADIHQHNGRESFVRGAVYPTKNSLDFKFNTDHINVEILKPFMSAFTTDIKGEASGWCELYGTFKLLNMKGRMFADAFKIKIDYTNTFYNVSDSIILDPGIIKVTDATIYDDLGNTATLNGTVTHTYFKDACFDFAITDAKNLLCYNTNEKINPIWYGKIFGNGAAFVKGEPGLVNIDINMASAPKSSFTFVLSDMEEAGEYSFITFTDKRKEKRIKEEQKNMPEFLKNIHQQKQQESNPSVFNLNLLVDANPNVAMTLVMDPEGGDKIRAIGSGNMKVTYSSNEEMKVFGSYTVDQGKYNFTLQDIIIREFKIKNGAAISFHGDPLQADVDLQAAYSLNANLQDLDESFVEDKDLNRTLVPVNALLNLSGVISHPSISFDLEFPTLTQDVYRKVRSIISTDDMMNQQIIYLLALNRFYTPEYMGNTNKNNEFASVASSTISSQLSNMLGQLSDKWTIAPNLHTDKGDFSDVEVELALSSRLLNNRLLLNGNFGYSDNSMNNNNFIGDFDIEYLLTKNGTIRLKAYNRYNDQKYYIKNSLTTQGVGIVFKHDFNRFLEVFKRKRAKKKQEDNSTAEINDTTKAALLERTPVVVTDSITH